MNTETLKYILFGASILICFISFFRSEKLIEKPFFIKCSVVAGISTSIGIILDVTNVFNMRVGMLTLLMSLTTFFLLYFSILKFIFRKLKGFDFYPLSRIQDIGRSPISLGFRNKKPQNKRVVIWEDVLFSTLHILLSVYSIFFLLAYLARRL